MNILQTDADNICTICIRYRNQMIIFRITNTRLLLGENSMKWECFHCESVKMSRLSVAAGVSIVRVF